MTQPIPLPYGLREIKVAPYTDSTYTALGAKVKFPNSRTLQFTESEESQELRGDDRLVAVHGSGPLIEWELEGGGLPYEAIKVMYGGTISETGVAPNRVKRYYKLVTDQRPYFYLEGQVISDSGGDVHCIIYRAKADGDLDGTFGDQEFFLTGASGKGLESLMAASLGRVWELVQNETITAIV